MRSRSGRSVGDHGGVSTAAPQAAPPSKPSRRRFGSVSDMVRSLAAVLGAVLVILWLTPRADQDPVRVIDFGVPLQQARAAAPYDVYAPQGLPERWRPTSARATSSAEGIVWHLGLVTPQDRYAAVAQRPAAPAAVEAAAGPGRDEGAAVLAGTMWQRRLRDDGERSLWRADERAVVAVTGNASWAELEQLAGALVGG